MIFVSICMITYNHEKYVRRAIRGVLNQRFNLKMEIVIVDDCSKDKTSEIVREEINLNKNHNVEIKFIQNLNNIGVNKNFIKALNLCLGKYIAICEGDDFWDEPEKINKQFNFLENNLEHILCFHGTRFLENDLILNHSKIFAKKTDLCYDDLINGAHTLPTLSIFFRNIVKNKLPKEFDYITNCDTFLFLYLSQFGRLHYDESIINVYHIIHNGGIWSSLNSLEKSLQSYRTYSYALKYFKDKRLHIPLVNFGNSVIINSIKAKRYNYFFKYYILNLFSSLKHYKAGVIFLKKHLNYFSN